MNQVETLEELYKRYFNELPERMHKEPGHFNVLKVQPPLQNVPEPLSFSRRDYYKIMLVKGSYRVHFADGTVEVKKQALVFSSPQIPYNCEFTNENLIGFFCVFTPAFFDNYGNLNDYEIFQPGHRHIFELTDEQLKKLTGVYKSMLEELYSDYIHRDDALRHLTFELIHFAMKMHPVDKPERQPILASQKTTTIFLELLERQFPIDENHLTINFRSAFDFAKQLNVHVNHLNRAVKATTGKTTSQIISERILQESKSLLKQSEWSVSEIAFSLGFREVTHFHNFFKKYTQMSPLQFRNV
jgi:AraC-like DNA-binding protein